MEGQTARSAVVAEAEKPAAAAVEVDGLSVRFETPQGLRSALEDVTFALPRGQFCAVVGPSGCGKSTALNVIAGLQPSAAGEVRVFGEAVRSVSLNVGYLFQKDALLPWKSVLQNVMLPLTFRRVPPLEAKERARDWLARVKLKGFEDYYPHQLSGGMKKRVALATVFVYSPPLLLMDEPFAALDVQTRNLMENELLDLWFDQRPTVLFVTHDLEEAIGLSDSVFVFTAGPGRVKGRYDINLPRPRNLTEIRFAESFQQQYRQIWSDLRGEVLMAYEREERLTQ